MPRLRIAGVRHRDVLPSVEDNGQAGRDRPRVPHNLRRQPKVLVSQNVHDVRNRIHGLSQPRKKHDPVRRLPGETPDDRSITVIHVPCVGAANPAPLSKRVGAEKRQVHPRLSCQRPRLPAFVLRDRIEVDEENLQDISQV